VNAFGPQMCEDLVAPVVQVSEDDSRYDGVGGG
jgi:hypothetical protein